MPRGPSQGTPCARTPFRSAGRPGPAPAMRRPPPVPRTLPFHRTAVTHSHTAPASAARTLPFLRTAIRSRRRRTRLLPAHTSVPQDGQGRTTPPPPAPRARFCSTGRPTPRPAERKRNRRPVSVQETWPRTRPVICLRPPVCFPRKLPLCRTANRPSCRTETKSATHHGPTEVSPREVSPDAVASSRVGPRPPRPVRPPHIPPPRAGFRCAGRQCPVLQNGNEMGGAP